MLCQLSRGAVQLEPWVPCTPLNAFPDAQEAKAQGLWNAVFFFFFLSGSPLLALHPWATGTPRECKLRWVVASSVRLSADVLCRGNRLRLLPDAQSPTCLSKNDKQNWARKERLSLIT